MKKSYRIPSRGRGGGRGPGRPLDLTGDLTVLAGDPGLGPNLTGLTGLTDLMGSTGRTPLRTVKKRSRNFARVGTRLNVETRRQKGYHWTPLSELYNISKIGSSGRGFEDAEGYILCRGGLLGRYLILDGRNTPSTSQIWKKS